MDKKGRVTSKVAHLVARRLADLSSKPSKVILKVSKN